ncbi:hypothetical protein FPSE_12394 [Fusarium pseudograminearum CS3096]|uniref:Uncharacterized protein n=2 Tax=Fusarium pseudograminearum TaxID=101028 RepID=K3V3A0_FUSPC|nr:hypothetical protein FPSE_12394 [Fusarium pseudograminearum CS3096]EKJ67427.1 hypothetical protein FPSE_12394 [Fusarium pseudograminearum CS3096]CEG02889.1 unnamed protein product [Fusarium pseudograminearum CS3487]
MEGRTKRLGRRANIANEDQNPTAQEWAQSLLDRMAPITSSDLATLLGPPPESDEEWTDQDEAYIDRKWATSTEKKAQDKIEDKSHPMLLSLWKTCLRVFRTSPVDLISPLNNLRYSVMSDDDTSRHLYSKAFCTDLTSIMVHPFICGRQARLVIVLQFAAICRIDERELWKSTAKRRGACPALNETFRLMEKNANDGTSEPVKSLHDAARQSVLRVGEVPSNLSDLLHWLGQVISSTTRSVATVHDQIDYRMGMPVLPICITDLKNIQQAINTMQWNDEAYACTTAEALESYKSITRAQELPSSHDLKRVFGLAHKALMRALHREDRGSHFDEPLGDEPLGDVDARHASEPPIEGQLMEDDGDYSMNSSSQQISISDDVALASAIRSPSLGVGGDREFRRESPATTPGTEMILNAIMDMKVQFQVEMTTANAKLDAKLDAMSNEMKALRAELNAVSSEHRRLVEENGNLSQHQPASEPHNVDQTDNEQDPGQLDVSYEGMIEWMSD